MCWCLTQSQGLQDRPAAPGNCFVDWVSFDRIINSVVNSSLLIICCHTCRWKDYSHFWPRNGEKGFPAILQWAPAALNTRGSKHPSSSRSLFALLSSGKLYNPDKNDPSDWAWYRVYLFYLALAAAVVCVNSCSRRNHQLWFKECFHMHGACSSSFQC